MKLSVLANLYGTKTLDETLKILTGLGVHTVEIGAGGYPGKAHCNPEELLADSKKFDEFVATFKKYDVEICALAAHGNALHPDTAIADFSQKMFVRVDGADSVSAFNLYTYVFAAAVLLAFYLFNRIKVGAQGEKGGFKKLCGLLGFVFVMSVCLYMNSYFKTLAGGYISATQLYPLNQGAAVILSLLMSSIFFKEKVNLKCIVGIVLAFVALMLINLF